MSRYASRPTMSAVPSESLVRRAREEDGVETIVLAHPPVNALSRRLLSELDAAVRPLAADPSVRAVVLAADGAQFSAGVDLKELATLDPARAPEMVRQGQEVFERVAQLPVPTVVALHGVALGGALELGLACDLRVADDSAKLGAPEVTFGLMPVWGGTQRLARLVGIAKAQELCLTGQIVPAAEALRLGLVNKLVPGGQELRAARDLAHTIGQRAPRAIRAIKRAIRLGRDLPLAEGLALEVQLFQSEILPSRDLAEGLRAFTERRPPRFTGE